MARTETRHCKRCNRTTKFRVRRRRSGHRQVDCIPCQRRRDRKRHPLYSLWNNILQRCLNANAWNYRYYGGVGVTVCERWQESFEAFVEDLGERPSQDHTVDRIDPARGYEPGNVRWATWEEQNDPTRKRSRAEFERLWEAGGKSRPSCEHCGARADYGGMCGACRSRVRRNGRCWRCRFPLYKTRPHECEAARSAS